MIGLELNWERVQIWRLKSKNFTVKIWNFQNYKNIYYINVELQFFDLLL